MNSITTAFLRQPLPTPLALRALPIRCFSTTTPTNASASTTRKKSNKDLAARDKAKKRKKRNQTYKMPDLRDITQYSLCDAIQYINAFEVGKPPQAPKYDLAVRLKCKKDGPVLRNTIKLPHTVNTDIRICVLVDPNSKAGKDAKAAGAYLVGADEVFQRIKDGQIDFERCITTPEMLPIIQKAGLPRILGPRGLMPSVKLNTVTDKVSEAVGNLVGGSTYREREGVVRMAIGQLAFSPEMVRDNMKAFISQLQREARIMTETTNFAKSIFEIVSKTTCIEAVLLTHSGPELDTLPGLLVKRNIQVRNFFADTAIRQLRRHGIYITCCSFIKLCT